MPPVSKGGQCSFRHVSNDREQTPPSKAATPSEPSSTRGRSMSRKRSIRDKSNPGRQKCCSNCENCTTIGLCLARRVQSQETRCKKSWDQFNKYDSHGLRFVKRESGKTKDHHLEKYKSKFLISEMKFEDRSQEETEGQQPTAQSKAWNLAKNI